MTPHIGYVLKRYPRYSETFVVTEILAHERAGAQLEIFALRPPTDTHFQDAISRVRAPVTYLFSPDEGVKAAHVWSAFEQAALVLPGFWSRLEIAAGEIMRDVHQAALLAIRVKTQGITHLHAHFATSATSVARMAAHFAQVPFTFTAHAKDIFHDDVRPDDLERKCASAAAVVTVSDFNKAYLQAAMPSVASRVRRVYNGMDLGLLPFRSPDDRRPLIVAVGRLIEKKGFGDLVAACAELMERGVAFECAIIGAGELGPELVADTERRGLAEVVRFLGPLPQRDVLEYIRQAAVMAAPCVVGADGNRDGLPTVLLEAMALGTPCVSTDVTGIPELVRDGDTGLLVPQHDPSSLAAALSRLLADPALRVAVAASARQLIEQQFDADRSAERLRAIWAEHAASLQESPVAVVA